MTIDCFADHAALPYYDALDDELVVAGVRLSEHARNAGRTPFYIYARDVVLKKLAELGAALPEGVALHYAIKANPLPALVTFIAQHVDGLDVASAGELKIALASGTRPENISFAGPGKRDEELRAAVAAGITVNIESEFEMRRLDRIGAELGKRPRAAIRVNPDFELKSSGMKMGGGPKQFGIDAERVPDALRAFRVLGLEFCGFHIYCGSQNLRPDAICDAQRNAVELGLRLAADAPSAVRVLNIGGGFGVPYFPGERALDLQPIGANLAVLVERLEREMPDAELTLELGRYLVSEAGLYVCRVLERKTSRGQVFLICDGGLHQHLAASGNFGQVIRKNYPVAVGNRLRGAPREVASVVGPLCTPLDLLADRMEMARAQVGDLIVVFQSGAYGFSASPLGFLSHPAPLELLA